MKPHTPTPWKYQAEGEMHGGKLVTMRYPIYTVEGKFGHPAESNREEDAAFIVRACNSHDALVAALKLSERNVASMVHMMPVSVAHQATVNEQPLTTWLEKIRAALKLAEEV